MKKAEGKESSKAIKNDEKNSQKWKIFQFVYSVSIYAKINLFAASFQPFWTRWKINKIKKSLEIHKQIFHVQ